MDLRTTYMGLDLANPLIVGASPLSDDVGMIRRLEDAGAGAIVMHSLFTEQLVRDQMAAHVGMDYIADSNPEGLSYFPDAEDYALGPDEYLAQIARLKEAVDVPVFGSLNGMAGGDWTRWAGLMAEAGADGLELNVYYLPLDGDESPDQVEARFLGALAQVKGHCDLPVAMKLTSFFSSPVHMARRLEAAGADALVLFNRVFQPDIDIEELEVTPALTLSDPSMLKMRLLWLAAMFGKVDIPLAASGGVHSTEDVIKAVMAGASGVQMTSALLSGGPEHLAQVLEGLEGWLVEHQYESLRQMCGSMSLLRCPDPESYERANYIRTLQRWHPRPL
ncbi:MAG: dihydroorotate dehydrogenase-like protein [Proteobacteria bacterium]|nr:dihydroorotate dehydrogenase-like protein [Pseudomonadota bacterium]MCP4919683.1 dihydroorotate dehydrogenase-like protein [Pseudomonadota bacterium]